MNNKLSVVFSIIVGFLLSLFVIQSVLIGSGNVLGNFFVYLTAALTIVAIINPRIGIYSLLLAGFYLDLMKRLLVIDGHVTFITLIQVLSLAPIVFAGCLFGLLVRIPNHPEEKKGGRIAMITFIVSLMGSLLILLTGLKGGGGIGGVADAGRQAAFVPFIWFGCYHFREKGSISKFWTTAIWMFLPVLFYAYWQLIYGYSDLEVEYALSGMSVMLSPLLDPEQVEYSRVFSTMSSAGAYGVSAIILGLYAIFIVPKKELINKLFFMSFGILCLASLLPGAGRSGWAMAIVIFAATIAFQSKLLTSGIYLFCGMFFVYLYSNPEGFQKTLTNNISTDSDNEWVRRASTTGTFADRSIGIKEWTTNPDYFSWLGHSRIDRQNFYVHDILGEIYLSSGIIGLSLIIVVAGFALFFLHSFVYRQPKGQERKKMAFYVASVFGVIFVAVTSGGTITVYPVNFFFWAIVSCAITMHFSSKTRMANQSQ